MSTDYDRTTEDTDVITEDAASPVDGARYDGTTYNGTGDDTSDDDTASDQTMSGEPSSRQIERYFSALCFARRGTMSQFTRG